MKRSRARRVPTRAAAALGVAALFGPAGCFSSNDGPAPPAGDFYFPTALAVSPAGRALYVVNSNFDLQYTGGTVQALDLAKLRAAVPKVWCRLDASGLPDPKQPECADYYDPQAPAPVGCTSFGLAERADNDQYLYPGRCSSIDINAKRGADGRRSDDDNDEPILRNSVLLGAFASDALVLAAPPEAVAAAGAGQSTARLAVVVRGDPSLTWLELDDDRGGEQAFRLECGQGGGEGRCGASHLAGKDPAETTRALTLPNEPFAIASTPGGEALAVTHQAGGLVSLFVHGWPGAPAPAGGAACAVKAPDRPELAFVLGGLQGRATAAAALPVPRFVREFGDVAYRPAFLVTYRDLPQVDRLLYFDDCASAPDRPFLGYGGSTSIGLSASGFDSRGIAVDPRARQSCENACAADDRACQEACAAVPVKVYVASRAPSSLLVGETTVDVTATGSTDLVRFYDIVSLSPGVSGVQMGTVLGRDGRPHPRAFVTCFDARFVYVYDPERNAIEGIVRTGRGPNALAFDPGLDEGEGGADPARAFGYVAHFTDSYVGVIDLNQAHDATYLTIVATVGTPRAPRDSRLLSMSRRPLAFAALALLALAAPAALPGCAQRNTQPPLRSLDRSGRVSLACLGGLSDATGNPGRRMADCNNASVVDIYDFAPQRDDAGRVVGDTPHVYAVVTQQTRGEVAVIDLSVDPAVTQSILDSDLATPGVNFLPVGAQPVDVATSAEGSGAFVAAAEPGRPGVYALPARELRGPDPRLLADRVETATLRSWPACRLPAAPGRMLLVQSERTADPAAAAGRLCPSSPLNDAAEPYQQRDVSSGDATSVDVAYPDDARPFCRRADTNGDGVADGPLEQLPCKPQLVAAGGKAEKLLVTLPERGELLVIDAQTLFERPPGSFDPCPIERALPLRVELPDAPQPAPAPAESCPALPAAGVPAGACPSRPNRPVAYPAAFQARPSAMAASGGRLYVADEGAPVIHVLSLEDGCALRELPPLLPSSYDDPGRPVFTSALAASPTTTDQRAFVYAVDRERGTLMAFDVSNGSADRSPLLRDRPDLNLFGSRDRLSAGGPVRDVTFITLAENVADENGNLRNGLCDPDTSSVDPVRRGDVFRTSEDYTDGAGPSRLRGVFALATLTSGVVRVLDVDDLDAACRGARTDGGFAQTDESSTALPAPLTGCESCAVGGFANTLGASGELSCRVVERHEMRSAFYFANKSETGLHAPAFQAYPVLTFNGASLRTDGTEEALPNPKLLGPGVPNPYYAPGSAPLQPGQPGYNCQVHSPTLVGADCQPVEGGGANPNYAIYAPDRPTLDPSFEANLWYFERGGNSSVGDPSPTRAERNFVVPDFREPRAHTDQNWSAWYEGPLPGYEGRYADSRLGATEPDASRRGFFDPDAAFCDTGVHDRAAARLEGARLLGVPADTTDPDARAAVERFADQHADYAEIANELLPPEDPYWGAAASEARPAGERCDYFTCEQVYGPATSPALARDFVVREAYQDRLLVDATARPIDPDCCFPTLVRYRVRTHNAWTVLGSNVGFLQRTVVDAASGRCVDQGVDQATGAICDPLIELRTGRAYEAFNPDAPVAADDPDAPLLLADDARRPCRDQLGAIVARRPAEATADAPCYPPALGDRLTFRNGQLHFVVYQGTSESDRDMVFSWSMVGGFSPLQINLNSRGGLVAPFASVFSPSLQRLVVTDGGQSGVYSLNLVTFGFRSYL